MRIAIVPNHVSQRREFIQLARSATEKSLGEVTQAVDDHTLLAEWELNMNDHQQVAQQIRSLFQIDKQGLGKLTYYVLDQDETYASVPLEERRQSLSAVQDILNAHDEDLQWLEDDDNQALLSDEELERQGF